MNSESEILKNKIVALERENAELKEQVSSLQYNYAHAKYNEKELLKQRDSLRAKLETAVGALEKCQKAAGRGTILAVQMWAREALAKLKGGV